MSLAKLKNYTTSIPATRSISEIQSMLMDFGAQQIMLEAGEERKAIGISFLMVINEQRLPFRLPVINAQELANYLYQDYRRQTPKGRKSRADFDKASYRIGWRIIRDLVHSQISIVATKMVRPEAVFLPYLIVDENNRTLSQDVLEGKLNYLLPRGADE